jgi:Flp pilus assembly protein TadD
MKAAACLTALMLYPPAASSAADWVRVETTNFIVYGDTSVERGREVAAEFERFREALARVIPGAGTPAAVPTIVVVFGSQRAFEPYRPRFNGKPVNVGGYFWAIDDTNIVAFAERGRDETLRTIFHEYVHLVLSNASHAVPAWLSEGLAEYYSTFQLLDQGRRAIVGRVIPSHLRLVNQNRLMSIEELLAVEASSSTYNEGARQSLFYAQSWALVHMLVSGTTNRSAALGAYARMVAEGTSSLDAWKQVFGEEKTLRLLERYVAGEVMTEVAYQFDRDIPRIKGDVSAVSAADVEAVLADLLRHVAPAEEASARFEKAIAIRPASARARALYGLHLLGMDEDDQARAQLVEASADRDDWLVQYHVATGLTKLATSSADPVIGTAARDALARVFEARPDLPHALVLSARLDSIADGDLTRALDTVRQARSVSPGRADYTLVEAFILMRRGEFTASRQLLQALQTPVHDASIRADARSMLRQVDREERGAADYLARLEGRTPAPREPEEERADREPEPTRAYRKLEAGEERAEGLLERIDCSSGGITLLLAVANNTERFSATTIDRIDFISYRNDVRGAITCGPRTPPDRVYLTWRPMKGTKQIVAVEFLPVKDLP